MSASTPTKCEYETTARGYKVVYNAPKDFFTSDHCAACADDTGDAVLMEEGECPRCGCYDSYKEFECCESCDREHYEARLLQDRVDELLEYNSPSRLQRDLEMLVDSLPELAEDLSEDGVKIYQDTLVWQKAYELAIAQSEAAEAPERSWEQVEAELKTARANYQSALMAGEDRVCSNFEDEVDSLEREVAFIREEIRQSVLNRAFDISDLTTEELEEELRDADDERRALSKKPEETLRDYEKMETINAWAALAHAEIQKRYSEARG
jgi:hypothetical protein